MTSDRRARERHLAGEPRASLERREAAAAAPPRRGHAVPGRSTLAEALGADAIDPTATVERQLAAAVWWLEALADAEREASAEASSIAASRVRGALQLAQRALAAVPSTSDATSPAGLTGVAALERRVREVRDIARPWLARAFDASVMVVRRTRQPAAAQYVQGLVDLFAGALEMVEAIAKVLYHLVTANPGRIKDMLVKWADRMRSVWERRGALADAFLQRWNAPSGWDRGLFQGEVLGWAMMTVLLVLVTVGASAAANAGSLAGRYPQVAQLLRTVDAVGDVTTYLGGAVQGLQVATRLPAAAADLVRGKLGPTGRTAPAAGELSPGHEAPARAVRVESSSSEAGGERLGRKSGASKPRMQTTAIAMDGGGVFTVNFVKDLSPRARSLVRKIEKQGFVRVSEVAVDDLVQISKWFDKEIAVVQSPYGRLRIVLGERRGVLGTMLKRGEVFLLHTHPVMRSSPDHFMLDLARAGKHVEAVVDWSGLVVFYSKSGILNSRNTAGWLEPLLGYEAAFLDAQRRVIGFAKVDIVDGPESTHIRVRE